MFMYSKKKKKKKKVDEFLTMPICTLMSLYLSRVTVGTSGYISKLDSSYKTSYWK